MYSLTTIFQTFILLAFFLPLWEGQHTVGLHAQSTRLWATYYGGTGDDQGFHVAADISGNAYLTGHTYSASSIASPGSFQNTHAGDYDAFLVKFSPTGNRLWATYYGGSLEDAGQCVVPDASGNVYVTGFTNSPGMAAGGFQNTLDAGGTLDGFLVKFDASTGNRLWATYYGGTGGDEVGRSVTVDNSGNVYMCGMTQCVSNIASAGAFQGSLGGGNDAFLVKFDGATGNRLWATYYGGSANEFGYDLSTDFSGNVYMSGYSLSPSGIASGGFQNAFGGGTDAFLVKFDGTTGNRIWATYYGGTDTEYGFSVACDSTGNVYMGGQTFSTSNIASGGFQNTFGGGIADAFLVKFNGTSGNRLWATYYGGTNKEEGYSLSVDTSGVYLAGDAYSTNNISSGGFQNTLSGIENLFVAKFDTNGNRLCATYYGAAHDEKGHVALDPVSREIYLSGYTPSSTGIASAGSFQSSFGGGNDACLIKLTSCATALNTSINGTNVLCKNQCTGTATANTVGGIGPYAYSWNTTPTQTTANATGLCAGTYTVSVSDATGGTVTSTVTITEPLTAVTASISNTVNVFCNGQCTGSATTSANGGASTYTYSWNTTPVQSTATATGLCQGTYTTMATDSNGCTATQTVTITEPAALTTNATSTPENCGKSDGAASINATGGSGTFTYTWSPSAQTTSMATGLAAGNYTATVTDANGCAKTQTVAVTSAGGLTLTVSSTQTECMFNNGTATANPSNGIIPYAYSWSNGQTTQTATGLAAGNYTVTVTDANSCLQIQTIGVPQIPGPTAFAAASSTSITLGASTSLSAAGSGTYQWSPSTGLSCITCANPVATPAQTTDYCVTVMDSNGCSDSACIKINVDIPCGTLFIPNAFSPNNDGENEMECVMGDCIQTLHFVIFDRWGEMIFETTQPKICWDGTYNGQPLNTAVFLYAMQATLTSGELITKKGTISLVR